jgi:SulP family sulfate permease
LVNYSGPVVGELSGSFISLKFSFKWSAFTDLLLPGTIIAVVGFAEPAAIARTFSKQDGSSWNPSKEFVSQGIANMASAISNSFPVGGSFGRSSLNKLAGATTPWSGAITGAFVLAVLPLASLLSELPNAILGATVIWAVMQLIKPIDFFELAKSDPNKALIALGTLLATLLTAPRIDRGIVIGLMLSFIAYLLKKYPMYRHINKNEPPVSR